MTGDTTSDDPRPTLAFRIGITGTRRLQPHLEASIRHRTADVLRRIKAKATQLAADPAAAIVYKNAKPDAPAVVFRAISPLAEGADRLMAEEALKQGYDLVAPLPFAQGDYERDFPDTVDSFRALLAPSTVIELDGARGADETASYEAVGRFVVQNSDVLIAIWDGQMTGKRGGTAEITRFAAESGVPIWWINVDDDSGARWLGDGVQWSERGDFASIPAAEILDAYLTKIILPPSSESREEANLIGRLAHRVRHWTAADDDPLIVFLTEQVRPPGQPIAWPWRLFGMAYARIAPRKATASHVATPTRSPAPVAEAGHWDALFKRADQLSIDYADRYRSSYLMIIFFAFFVDLASKVGVAVSERVTIHATFVELTLLLAIAALAVFNHVGAWHERWINYRLLAELCRGQAILSPLGEKLPRSEMIRGAAKSSESKSTSFPRDAWVAWFVEATSRAAPWPERDSLTTKRRALDLGQNLAVGQAAYHRQRSARSEVADRRLGQYGEWCFFATVVAIVARLILLLLERHYHMEQVHHVSELIESWATSLSAASAGFVAIRFYSEFGLLERQSQRMQRNMSEVERQLMALNINIAEPLTSIELGKALQNLSMAMLLDIAGWAELFRIRAVEAG